MDKDLFHISPANLASASAIAFLSFVGFFVPLGNPDVPNHSRMSNNNDANSLVKQKVHKIHFDIVVP